MLLLALLLPPQRLPNICAAELRKLPPPPLLLAACCGGVAGMAAAAAGAGAPVAAAPPLLLLLPASMSATAAFSRSGTPRLRAVSSGRLASSAAVLYQFSCSACTASAGYGLRSCSQAARMASPTSVSAVTGPAAGAAVAPSRRPARRQQLGRWLRRCGSRRVGGGQPAGGPHRAAATHQWHWQYACQYI